jgi:hypothetical protein
MAMQEQVVKFIRSKTEEDGINPDPQTYEWCICGNTNPVGCTWETYGGVDYYDKEFEPCKCACHLPPVEQELRELSAVMLPGFEGS